MTSVEGGRADGDHSTFEHFLLKKDVFVWVGLSQLAGAHELARLHFAPGGRILRDL